MQLGLNWCVPDDSALVRDLGLRPRYCKGSIEPNIDGGSIIDDCACMLRTRLYLDHSGFEDCELVVDLRTANVQAFLEHPRRGNDPAIYDWFLRWLREVLAEVSPFVRHWELWGEAACPYTGKGFTEADGTRHHEGMTYADLLPLVYEVIKDCDADLQVLLGGHGCDTAPNGMNLKFFDQVMDAGAAEFCDWNNLHPFILRHREDTSIEAMLRDGFARMRARSDLPLCATEFSWPTRADDAPGEYGSNVLPGVSAVTEYDAARWTDLAFSIFEDEGMQWLIWTHLRDNGGAHWGGHLGLLRRDGTPKGKLLKTYLAWQERGA